MKEELVLSRLPLAPVAPEHSKYKILSSDTTGKITMAFPWLPLTRDIPQQPRISTDTIEYGRKFSLPKVNFRRFSWHHAEQQFDNHKAQATKSPVESDNSPSPLNPSAADKHHYEGQERTVTGPTIRKRRHSSIVETIASTVTTIHNLVKFHRVALHEAGDPACATNDPEPPLWTDQFDLDLPESISKDKSELDYLRRTNWEAAENISIETKEDIDA